MSCVCEIYPDKNLFITKSTSVEVGTGLNITLPNTPIDIKNKDMIKFTICQSIPECDSTLRAYVLINHVTIPLVDKCGNWVRAGALRRGVQYYTNVSTEPQVLVVSSHNLCKVCYDFPVIPVTSAVSVAEEVVTEPVAEVVEKQTTSKK